MFVKFEGREWELNLDKVTFQQGMAIQLMTGMSVGAFEDALDVEEILDEDGKPTGKYQDPGPQFLMALGGIYWLMHNQNGDIFPTAKADFVISEFLGAMGEAMQAELERVKAERAVRDAAAEAGPDPTRLASTASSPPGHQSPELSSPTLPCVQPAGEVPVTVSGPAGT